MFFSEGIVVYLLDSPLFRRTAFEVKELSLKSIFA